MKYWLREIGGYHPNGVPRFYGALVVELSIIVDRAGKLLFGKDGIHLTGKFDLSITSLEPDEPWLLL